MSFMSLATRKIAICLTLAVVTFVTYWPEFGWSSTVLNSRFATPSHAQASTHHDGP
jgi:hypothetical protein